MYVTATIWLEIQEDPGATVGLLLNAKTWTSSFFGDCQLPCLHNAYNGNCFKDGLKE